MKKWLWIILILSLLVTSVRLFERTEAEWNYNTYEVAVPFKEVKSLIDKGADEEDVFNGLKSSGVNAMSIGPESIEALADKGEILSLSQDEFFRFALFSGYSSDKLPEKKGLFISLLDSSFPVMESVEKVFNGNTKKVEINERDFIYIEGDPKKIEKTYLGFSEENLNKVKEYGLSTIIHVPVADVSKENEFIWEQAFTFDDRSDQMLFSGVEALGYPNNQVKWAGKLKEKGISTLSIEDFDQKGFERLARSNNLNVIRLRSFDLERESLISSQEKAIRAVKERNIRVLYFHLTNEGEPEEALEENMAFFKSLNSNMPGIFTLGDPETFSELSKSFYLIAAALLSSVLFVMLTVETLLKRKTITVGSGVGMFLVAAGYLILGSDTLLKLMALAVAVITPVYAALVLKPIKNKRDIIYQYVRAIGISFVGIWIGISLLYGNEYSLHIDQGFRGVKILYVFPIVFTLLFVVYHLNKGWKFDFAQVKALLALPIKYGHLILFGILGSVLFYYISRTGSFGSVSSYELMFRQKLEDLLYVRPRTKEFLIGFPFYILSLYLFMTKMKKAAFVCLIPATIGWLSLVNTFTHLHIPLYVSVLRSIYSLSIGLLVGIAFIFIYKAGQKYYLKLRARW
ncbi:DUF5693 family protein [Pseudalkalibacillus salsuginis]|uniref:DUF5693 family protein n=1 Tax=Pseudalkalibacillus salsuginis TaxID=2910972 RepID=UPI001F22023D|nr:DUF5693 family protein [Pseudalkalibacillus salsuginis]MCF6410113.1 DUF5693 family protein [Pseudalkalibacillus salsuginis]